MKWEPIGAVLERKRVPKTESACNMAPISARTGTVHRRRLKSAKKLGVTRHTPSSNFNLGPVVEIPVTGITESPENKLLYKPIHGDEPDLQRLADDIAERGILEPLVISGDNFIVSGHRRYRAAIMAGLTTVPCRQASLWRNDDPDQFLALLRAFNRQRVKGIVEVLHEEVLDVDPDQAVAAVAEYRAAQVQVDATCVDLGVERRRASISKAKLPLLNAIKRIIKDHADYLPISERQIHYSLLNDPPLIHANKKGSAYRNDRASAAALSELVTRARIRGIIPMDAICDETRPCVTWNVFNNAGDYLHNQLDSLFKGYWRNLQLDQPHHTEVICEKLALRTVIERAAMDFCIPYTVGRGFASLSPRNDILKRFRASGKKSLLILALADFDPDGVCITESFGRSLRDDFDLPADVVKVIAVGLTYDQATTLDLPPGQKAKKSLFRNYSG